MPNITFGVAVLDPREEEVRRAQPAQAVTLAALLVDLDLHVALHVSLTGPFSITIITLRRGGKRATRTAHQQPREAQP